MPDSTRQDLRAGNQTAPSVRLPAMVERTGYRQLSISLSDERCRVLEQFRVSRGLRSWAQAIALLIDKVAE